MLGRLVVAVPFVVVVADAAPVVVVDVDVEVVDERVDEVVVFFLSVPQATSIVNATNAMTTRFTG